MNSPAEATPNHGSLSIGEGVLHTPNPTVDGIFWVTACLAVVVLLVAVTDLILRGRWRSVSLALATMLTAVAPLLGLYAAADVVVSAALGPNDPGVTGTINSAVDTVKAGVSVGFGAAVGVLAAVVAAVLKIVPVRQPRSTNP